MEKLEEARRATLARIGRVSERVLSRASPLVVGTAGPRVGAWPSSTLGKQLLVRRDASVLVVTDGISDPWDPKLHAVVPPGRFGFELALEVPLARWADGSDEAVAGSWVPAVLWAATDWLLAERFDLKGHLIRFECVTLAVPCVAGLERLAGSNGHVGALIGIPYVGDALGAQVVLAPETPSSEAVWLLTMKLLTADEYDWAMGVRDGARAKALAHAFLRDPSRHDSWPVRPSILPKLSA